MIFFKNLFFIICSMLFFITDAYAWSSMNTGNALGTHQFINKTAYKEIRKHPGFNYSNFPSLDDIQRHGSISLIKTGLGPDVDGNSKFSQHWYNPANNQGQAPKTIKKLHSAFKKALNRPAGNYTREQALENKAHLAAYSAHYIQDMTCPMHISGMEGSRVSKNRIGSRDDISPYAAPYSKKEWQLFVDRYNDVKDQYTDFFDPLYYNGDMIFSTFGGTHVLYEAHVETLYHLQSSSQKTGKWKTLEDQEGYIPDIYEKVNKDMALLAIKAATETRYQIGTRDAPRRLWINNKNEATILASIQVPYEEWWRAVQLTYVTWRSSFCALHSRVDDVKFVKISNHPKEYKLSISVDNLEPEASAKSVKVYYKIEGDVKTEGNIDFTEPIPKDDTSGWYSADKSFKIEDPRNLSGKITIEIRGEYNKKIPDSGFKRVEYDLKDLAIEAIEMPDLFNHKQDSAAIQSLKTGLSAFNVTIESVGAPGSQNLEYRVKSQYPVPGEWVAPGENVVLKVYGKFSQDAPAGTSNSINQTDKTKKDRDQAEKLCNETKHAATALSAKIQYNEKKFISFGAKLKAFFKKLKVLKQESKFIKTAHKDLEKKAAAIAEISHELEKLTLKICETTKELNDHTKTDSEHDQNYDWINNKKESLKERLESANNIIKDADAIEKKSKKRLEAAKLLKDTSQAALQKISKDIEVLLETNFSKSMDMLNQKAGMISTDNCPEDVFTALREATKHYQKNQDKLTQITAFYKTIKTDFDKKVQEVENLNQIYQKTAYLLDLSKAYVERAENAAVKGAFCTVLAENIMEKVFIPDVRGMEINKAASRVSQKGLNVTRSEIGPPSSQTEGGMVENIVPGITKRVKKGTNVTLSFYDERPDRQSQLANYDCRQWPGSQPVWDTPNDRPACGCTGDMEWNQDNTRCISRIDAALANANCGYPNSYPVWNPNRNLVMCECIPGTVWNRDRSACIDQRQAALENFNCSQYPGTIPNYDNNGNLGCACPGGTEWIPNMNRCVDQQEIALANADCSHKPGSAPRWNYITNQADCECQLPYSENPMTGKCVDFLAQLEQDNREFSQEMERDRQAFDQEMAERRRQDQEQNQKFFNNMMDIWDQASPPLTPSRVPSTPSRGSGNTGQSKNNKYNGPLCKGHHMVCGHGYNEYKHAVKDYNQDKICDICRRPYAKQGYRVFTKELINGPCVKYYSKLDGPICQGHILICDQGYGRNWRMAIDRNPQDRICDICGRSFKKSGNKVRGVITKKNVKCREEKK